MSKLAFGVDVDVVSLQNDDIWHILPELAEPPGIGSGSQGESRD